MAVNAGEGSGKGAAVRLSEGTAAAVVTELIRTLRSELDQARSLGEMIARDADRLRTENAELKLKLKRLVKGV